MPEQAVLLMSCEHAVNTVPATFAELFEDRQDLLTSHRGYDPGALDAMTALGKMLGARTFATRVTRLLVDHNRSPHHPALWSAASRSLEQGDKEKVLRAYYEPFRRQVATCIADAVNARQRVVHLSVHSFVPILDGKIRTTHLGLLYDPSRAQEAALAAALKKEVQERFPELVVHRNAPYQGTSDCHQNTYRKMYPADRYLALELELNQGLLLADGHFSRRVTETLGQSISEALASETISW